MGIVQRFAGWLAQICKENPRMRSLLVGILKIPRMREFSSQNLCQPTCNLCNSPFHGNSTIPVENHGTSWQAQFTIIFLWCVTTFTISVPSVIFNGSANHCNSPFHRRPKEFNQAAEGGGGGGGGGILLSNHSHTRSW